MKNLQRFKDDQQNINEFKKWHELIINKINDKIKEPSKINIINENTKKIDITITDINYRSTLFFDYYSSFIIYKNINNILYFNKYTVTELGEYLVDNDTELNELYNQMKELKIIT